MSRWGSSLRASIMASVAASPTAIPALFAAPSGIGASELVRTAFKIAGTGKEICTKHFSDAHSGSSPRGSKSGWVPLSQPGSTSRRLGFYQRIVFFQYEMKLICRVPGKGTILLSRVRLEAL
jgi:hypothetical protein